MKHAWWVVALVFAACNGSAKDDGPNDDADADTDTDADSDSDSDTDTDTDIPVDADADGFASDVDCDDADDAVFPGAPDLCGDDRVTDCDRDSDDGLVTLDGTQGFADLAAALTAAVADSEILICPGTYQGNFAATVPVRLVPFGESDIVLDGNNAGTTLSVPPGSEIVGLTITGGNAAQSGGGILLTGEGDLLVQDCIVERNAARFGAGLAIGANSVATVVNTVFEANYAEGGGGVSVGPGSVLDLGTSSVTGNTAELYGGGVFLDGGSLVGGLVDGNTLTDYVEVLYENGNLGVDGAAWGGAGVAAIGTASVTGTEISGNVASEGGGGISVMFGDLTVIDAAIHDNRGFFGGGFGAIAATLQLEGTTEVYANTAYTIAGGAVVVSTLTGGAVRDNTAQDYGGGIVAWDSEVDGTSVSDNVGDKAGGIWAIGAVVLREVTVSGNQATSGGGIGSDSGYSDNLVDSLTIEDSTITGNDALDGGGLFTNWPTTITGTTIADNTALLGAGLLIDGGSVTMSGGFVVRNAATEGGGGIWLENNTIADVTGTDFGDGADDNSPSDVHTGGIELSGYGASATFACDDLACVPAP